LETVPITLHDSADEPDPAVHGESGLAQAAQGDVGEQPGVPVTITGSEHRLLAAWFHVDQIGARHHAGAETCQGGADLLEVVGPPDRQTLGCPRHPERVDAKLQTATGRHFHQSFCGNRQPSASPCR
jgi:hypothetical protein